MLPRIIDLAAYAREGSIVRCARHLSWAAKLLWLTQLCSQDGVALGDAQTRVADHDFCHTDPQRGTLWRLWDQGMVDPLVTPDDAEACLIAGPQESRDWGRGRIIERFYDDIADVDWSYVELRSGEGLWSPRLRIEMPQLDTLSKRRSQEIIEAATDPQHLSQLLASQGDSVTRAHPLDDVSLQVAVVPRNPN
jgi:hypothetical protein